MAHHHHFGPCDNKLVVKNLRIAFWLNLTFTIIEIVGGIVTNSMAILSDAVHDLGDTITIGLALVLEKYAQKPPDKVFSYGYRRFSILAALVSSLILIFGSIIIMIEVFPRLYAPEAVKTEGMMILAVLGIFFNGLAVLRLKSGNKSSNQKVISLHLMEDVLGWVAVLAGSITMHFFDLPIIDPILSLLISAYILYNAIKPLKGALKIFLQAVPESIDIDTVKSEVELIDGVLKVDDIRSWSMDDNLKILSVHVTIRQNGRPNTLGVKEKIRESLSGKGLSHITIDIESTAEA